MCEEGGVAEVPFTTGATELPLCILFIFEERRWVLVAVFFAHINQN
jgi:hypothetical protein